MARSRSRKKPDNDQVQPQPETPVPEVSAPAPVQPRPTKSDDPDPIVRQNAPVHCPYCLQPCEPKTDAMYTTYRCVNKACGIAYSHKVPRMRRSDVLGPKHGNDALSAR